ncbi:hypothetical protein Q604_UNBC17876G0002, partial [human gut metagenome]
KYIFFIPANINSSDTDDNQKSDNAVLSNIKVKGQTLYNLDEDKNGFTIIYNTKIINFCLLTILCSYCYFKICYS